ncbi:MAG: NUDIX hydrolase [Planctomycetota bacterium]
MSEVPEWFYRQAAAVPVRHHGRTEICLVTTRRGKWIIPKGVIDPGATAAETAAQEAFEEAGVRGRVQPRPLGVYRYDKWGGTCTVTVFRLDVDETLDRWPESDVRERAWLDPEEAVSRVRPSAVKTLLRALSTEQ